MGYLKILIDTLEPLSGPSWLFKFGCNFLIYIVIFEYKISVFVSTNAQNFLIPKEVKTCFCFA